MQQIINQYSHKFSNCQDGYQELQTEANSVYLKTLDKYDPTKASFDVFFARCLNAHFKNMYFMKKIHRELLNANAYCWYQNAYYQPYLENGAEIVVLKELLGWVKSQVNEITWAVFNLRVYGFTLQEMSEKLKIHKNTVDFCITDIKKIVKRYYA